MLVFPRRSRRTRWITIAYGTAVFLWSGPESGAVLPVALLGLWGALLAAYSWATSRLGGRRIPPLVAALLGSVLGAAVGAGTALCTVGLMLFKDVRHAHLFPDFPPQVMGAVLARTPVWMAAGALVGFGGVLLALGMAGHAAERKPDP